ncbi:MAG: hypothetical protein K9N35_09670, partial [Candidatus Marinimicrobia bacterium]|nr:hypothetical protein [Candidatus Neomarinimicrobiota bacterium]
MLIKIYIIAFLMGHKKNPGTGAGVFPRVQSRSDQSFIRRSSLAIFQPASDQPALASRNYFHHQNH